MVCRLFGTKPLYEPIVAYEISDHWEQKAVKFETKYNNFHII